MAGLDAVHILRKLQKRLRDTLRSQPRDITTSNTEEFLLTRNCIVLSQEYRDYYNDVITPVKYFQLRSFFQSRILSVNADTLDKLTAGIKMMMDAKMEKISREAFFHWALENTTPSVLITLLSSEYGDYYNDVITPGDE
ncbi:hypothetical protein HDU86_001623 [Geranomyces michiganensis]|nr:hypothetical protein HDU86_001623 [Geranomyces michiganensis]